ncbi:unnamed protein product [Eruca vesicaria subsp. sativa]|uniref:Uncharacterized protein n=1 Tax=Eruca vesicaria subsp. sativa TaxID=29727 RepID=A0ABC8LL97_ERUVS|nr:unnamed protein product [Eruca vesicaria subsp. sativa]
MASSGRLSREEKGKGIACATDQVNDVTANGSPIEDFSLIHRDALHRERLELRRDSATDLASQVLPSTSPSQRPPLQQQQHQQLRQQQLQVAQLQQRPFEAGVCVRRFMMVLHRIKQRPADNCITFWRKFVAEYFSPRAKQRLCFSQYKGAGDMLNLGVLPTDMWECDLCRIKSGKGVEASFDVLARLFETKYANGGIIDELLSLDRPREYRALSGVMILDYRRVVQETLHEQFRVVRQGHLRITFSPNFKILVWEFCARSHQVFLFRIHIAPQVNQSNSNMVLRAGRQLAKSTGGKSLNHLGYPKKYVRALQIHEVVKSMKDLMDFTYDHRIGPIEAWKRLSEQTSQAQMALNPGNNKNNHYQLVGRGAVNGSAEAAAAQSIFMILNAMKKPYSSQSQSPYLSQQRQNLATCGFPQMQQQHRPNTLQQTHSHHFLQPPHSNGNNQELQKPYENPSVQQQQAFSGQNGDNSNAEGNPTSSTSNISGGVQVPSRNNSSKADSNINPHLSEDATEAPDDFSADNFSKDSDV